VENRVFKACIFIAEPRFSGVGQLAVTSSYISDQFANIPSVAPQHSVEASTSVTINDYISYDPADSLSSWPDAPADTTDGVLDADSLLNGPASDMVDSLFSRKDYTAIDFNLQSPFDDFGTDFINTDDNNFSASNSFTGHPLLIADRAACKMPSTVHVNRTADLSYADNQAPCMTGVDYLTTDVDFTYSQPSANTVPRSLAFTPQTDILSSAAVFSSHPFKPASAQQ
jgi:hypothetical protein